MHDHYFNLMKKFPVVKNPPYWNFWRVIFAGWIINSPVLEYLIKFFKFPLFLILGVLGVWFIQIGPSLPAVILVPFAFLCLWIYNAAKV